MRLIDADALKKRMVNEPVKAVQDVDFQAEWFTRIADTVCHMIDMVDDAPTVEPASPWHRVEEPPKYTARYVVWCGVNWYGEGMHGDFMTANYNTVSGRWSVDCDKAINGPLIGEILYWMPIEPPREEEHGN